MEKQSNLFKINKKTIYRVIIFHFVLVLSLIVPLSFKKTIKNHLAVNEIILIPEPKPKTLPITKAPIRKIAPKPLQQKKPTPILKKTTPILKKPHQNNQLLNNALVEKLENQIKSLDTKKDKIPIPKELFVPKKITLNLDNKINKENINNPSTFKEILIKQLQENLKFPEYGEVKVSFCIHPSGKITDISILDYKSEENQNYLKNNLSNISFKNMGTIFQEKQKFIVIFKND